MRRIFSLSAIMCLVYLITANAQVRVLETESKASFSTGNLQTKFVLQNTSNSFPANVKLEILDTDDKITAVSETLQIIKSGAQTLEIPLSLTGKQADSSEILWSRLRYTITPNGDNKVVSGIIALSEMIPDIFEIRASATKNLFAGMNYRVRVRAFHPVTNIGATNVKINGVVKLDIDTTSDNDKLELTANGSTDKEGYATLDFKIPANTKLDNDGEIKLTGAKNGIRREAEEDLDNLKAQNTVYLNTDKPLYQPDQSFYVRGLYFTQNGANSATANAGQELEFIIEDEDETVLYRETVKTSRFGVASAAWKIPENAKLGTYRVRVENDGDYVGQTSFKVSRYDLPNFTVAAKPNKTFYLPNETTAEIEVRADYLFGKPVEKGKVRVVREKDRKWNYKAQKYDVDEEKAVEGETGADGKFTAKFDLAEAHKDLKDEEYSRFEDLHFAAYFTDLTSNRTEQRRFDVRVTKEAIHVYLVGLDSSQDHNPKLPLKFYLSTFYADGAPAVCALKIKGKYEDEPETRIQTLTKLKTNQFGAGKVEFTAPKRADEIYTKDLQMKIAAVDAQNQAGSQEEEIDIDEVAKQLQIRTKQAIYRPNEPLEIEIFATENEADVFVDVVKDYSVVESRLVKLKNGHANLKIPFQTNFKGELTIAAYARVSRNDEDKAEETTITDAKGIVYPHPNNLKLTVETSQTTYKPGAEAAVNFNVVSNEKTKSETALGVVVFDKAIEERARTDANFGGNVNLFSSFNSLIYEKAFGGISLKEINEFDQRKKFPAELQLAAEVMLADSDYEPNFFESSEYRKNLAGTFRNHFLKQTFPLQIALRNTYNADFTHPTDIESLQKILQASGIDFASLRDPWAMPYRAVFTIERDENVVTIESSGANKTFDNPDDFSILQMKFKYFTPFSTAIDKAISDYHIRTTAFIRDFATLREELKKRNVDLDALRDRWNQPYIFDFGVDGRNFTLNVKSLGANGKPDEKYSGDDFTVWTKGVDYFAETESRSQVILSDFINAKKAFPKDEAEFRAVLKEGGIDFDKLRDGWQRPVYLSFETFSRYADKVKTESVAEYGAQPQEKTTILPVTQQVIIFKVRSNGADGINGNADDVNLATFSGVIAEQSKDDLQPQTKNPATVFVGGKGAIRGKITDQNGAIIPNADVTATNEQTGAIFFAASNDEGIYLLKNLPSGKYKVEVEYTGFKNLTTINVPVQSSTLTELNLALEGGAINSVANVVAETAEVSTSTDSKIQTNVKTNLAFVKGATIIEQNSTPRLREYFPETLLWQPELITDLNGKAALKFKLGDNITTWKLAVIGSNLDGKIGIAEKEIQAFQPFFVDLDAPKILTVGDEISLPVQVRNYTENLQKVNLTMANAPWFSFLGAANQKIEVAPNSTRNAVFGFRATNAVKAGKQRVTAIAAKDSDAIEKPVAVHPDGEEIVRTESQIFRDSAAFEVNFPANALPNSARSELKIYPNLLAHVAEAVTGLLERPYGCGEQTISSTYPNLMILKVLRNSDKPQLKAQAQKFLQQGYERLLNYQHSDGGFSVWTQDAPDAALTVYALRFLSDAGEFIEVDPRVIAQAQTWLLKAQNADGSWTRQYSWEKVENKQRTKILTTYIARTLAKIEKSKPEKSKDAQISLQKALNYLKTRNAEIDEPFAIAGFALAAFDSGDTATGLKLVEKLQTMALAENGGAYWNLETNTPFYGWGLPGRIETTALVVQALEKAEGGRMKDEGKTQDLITRGIIFLLKNKDRYGVWYSTQATINVLDAFLATLTDEKPDVSANRNAEIFVNGNKIKDVALPPSDQLAFPLSVNLENVAANNRVEIKIAGNATAVMGQTVSNHYISWADSLADGRNLNQSRQLRLAYNCDKLNAKPLEEITCRVEAERIGFRGYGMLLAEIGIPPGADVSRESLEKAKEANWNISRYDVLPDKIIVYLWSQAGGTNFDFKFKPRYGIRASSAPSIVYDYYNPEAKATVAPLKFNVK